MLAQSLCRRIAKVPSHDRLPHDDCEQRKLQCSQDDAESDACSKSDCILDESGRFVEIMIGGDVDRRRCAGGLSRAVIVSASEFLARTC